MLPLRLCALLVLMAIGATGAVQPKDQNEVHQDAPEVLKIRIADTTLVPQQRISCAERFRYPKAEGEQVRSEFTGKLYVLETLRSESGVKPGAVITIRYDVYDKNCPGWVGPAQKVPLKKGEVLYAFLYRLSNAKSGLTAEGHSFVTFRPKLKPTR